MPIDRSKLKAFVQQTGPRGGLYYLTSSGEKKYGPVPTGSDRRAASKPSHQQTKSGSDDRGSVPADVLRRLPTTHTPAEHEQIAKDFLAKHVAGLDQAVDELKRLAPAGAKVTGRVKDVASAVEKVARKPKYGTADQLQDGTGLRVITKSTEEVADTVANIKKHYKVLSEDDYISNPKDGYRSHHLIIEGKDGLQKEVQIRTENQHRWSTFVHDRVYKQEHATGEQRAALADPEMRKKVETYLNAMSEHLYRLDRGRGSAAGEPQPDPEMERLFGRM